MDDTLIIKKLEENIKTGKYLIENLEPVYGEDEHYLMSNISHNAKYYEKATTWLHSSSNLLERRFGKSSEYYNDFDSVIAPSKGCGYFYRENVMMGNGVLVSILDALRNGLTEDLFYKQELIVFNDMLQQANSFLEQGHRIAAALYGRVVLETTIKEYAKKFDIEMNQFDDTIIELRKKGAIIQPFEQSLRANYKIGSLAAHGHKDFEKITDGELKENLSFIKGRVLTLE
jgi:hypothetical protein